MSNSSLRFGALVRVSTEQQEKHGESLRTQRSEIEKDVELLEGSIVGWYGGQEHATPGWEKKEVDRLLADASKGKFNAVIVANADRWSRDNDKSQDGLNLFKKNKIKFFVSVTEYNLFSPEHLLFLEMSAVIGKFLASNQKRKSLLNRIHRAKRGIPAVGLMPFGRFYDRDKEVWSVDTVKQQQLQDIATRYLKGEQLPKLASEYGMNHSNLCKTLKNFSGSTWEVDFTVEDLDVHEVVSIPVPPLLDEQLVKDVRQRMEANRTNLHGRPKHEYLLSGRVFCAKCGYALCGDMESKGYRIYRHPKDDRTRKCGVEPRPRVRADILENQVVKELFQMFGNPAQIARSVKDAVPDSDNLLEQKRAAQEEMDKIARKRARIVKLVMDELLTDEQTEDNLTQLKRQEEEVQKTLERLSMALRDMPDEQTIQKYVQQMESNIFVYGDDGMPYEGGNDLQTFLSMTYEDKKRLIHAVFNAPLADGTPAGIYIDPVGIDAGHRRKNWNFEIKGRLEFHAVMQCVRHSPETLHTGPELPPFPFKLQSETAA